MSGNSIGKLFTVTSFGESHGLAIGCIVDGCPPGLELTEADLQGDLDRRKPGTSRHTTQRREADEVQILSGVFEGKTTGTSIGLLIKNKDQRSTDYSKIKDTFSKDVNLDVDHTSPNQDKETEGFPFDENTISYKLDVYEIENGADSDWGFNGISIIEFDSKSDRFFDPNPYFALANIDFRIKNNSVKVAYTIHHNMAIAIDNASKSIPEVRAGPIC